MGTACVSCSVSNCESCVIADVCNRCTNGFYLQNYACVCPSGSTVSGTDGTCVSCNVANCYRCDTANVCASYSPASLTSGTTNQSNNDGEVKALWAVVAILLLMVIVLGVLLIILAKKMAGISNSFKKIGSEMREEGRSDRTPS